MEPDAFLFASAWSLLIVSTLKCLVVFLLAGLTLMFSRRTSADMRHRVWQLTLLTLPALPLLSILLPHWRLAVLPPAPVLRESLAQVRTLESNTGDRPSAFIASEPRTTPVGIPLETSPSMTTAFAHPHVSKDVHNSLLLPTLCSLWLTGVILGLIDIAAGLWRVRQLGQTAVRPAADHAASALREIAQSFGIIRSITLLYGSEAMPMAWGWFRPVILLPADSVGWSEDRLRIVLLHELGHIRRADWPTQGLAQLVCSLYWFNPFVWLASRQLRIESERACDDLVLSTGVDAHHYAKQLLEVVRSMKHFKGNIKATVAMAQPSQIEDRLKSILNPHRRHGTLSRQVQIAMIAAMAGLAIPLAAVRVAAKDTPPSQDSRTPQHSAREASQPAPTPERTLRFTLSKTPQRTAREASQPQDPTSATDPPQTDEPTPPRAIAPPTPAPMRKDSGKKAQTSDALVVEQHRLILELQRQVEALEALNKDLQRKNGTKPLPEDEQRIVDKQAQIHDALKGVQQHLEALEKSRASAQKQAEKVHWLAMEANLRALELNRQLAMNDQLGAHERALEAATQDKSRRAASDAQKAAAKERLDAVRAQLDTVKAIYERSKVQYEAGFISAQEVDEAKANLESAQLQVQQAERDQQNLLSGVNRNPSARQAQELQDQRAQLEVQLQSANTLAARQKALYENGLLSRGDLDKEYATILSLQVQIAALKAQLANLKAQQLDRQKADPKEKPPFLYTPSQHQPLQAQFHLTDPKEKPQLLYTPVAPGASHALNGGATLTFSPQSLTSSIIVNPQRPEAQARNLLFTPQDQALVTVSHPLLTPDTAFVAIPVAQAAKQGR